MLQRARPLASGRDRLGRCCPRESVQRSRDPEQTLVEVLVATRHLHALRCPRCQGILLGDTEQVMCRLALPANRGQTPHL